MKYDDIALTIQWDRMVSIVDEIFLSLIRTSFSTIVREAYDLCCSVFDRQGRLLSQATQSAPSFLGTLPQTVRHFIKRFPPETLRPGDILITNDPWLGTGHLYDVSVIRPVFRGDTLVAFTGTVTHLPDIGGIGFSAVAREVFEEGLRIPPMKLAEAGKLNETLLNLIRENVRVPEQTLGDLHANIAANQTGARLIVDLMDEYGLESLDALSDAIQSRSEAAMREAIRELPDGRYTHQFDIEGFDIERPIAVACSVEIRGEEVYIDFAGTDPTIPAGVNVPFCYTYAFCAYAIKCITTPTLPNNDGSFQPVHATAPEGCILNATPPAATGGRHAVGHFVPFAVWGALADIVPERLAAETGLMNAINFTGRDLRGQPFSTLCFSGGGFGARATKDGLHTTIGPSNVAVTSVEALESTTGLLVRRKELWTDSGGAGQFRGGLGQELAFQNRSAHPVVVACFGNRTSFPAAGYQGGKPGAQRVFYIEENAVHPKGRHFLQPGEQVLMPGQTQTLRDAGGGGFGEAWERRVEDVAADVRAGYVSPDGALRDYGVEVDTDLWIGKRADSRPEQG
ncbi:hydantoinase B/oxoprolinase family protein [Candidatus Entotheonella palauensis]|uniref:hydantoinase B/oxoprolinase family protein n=1 Tax=Candidatus Entotheonella palauensis TaxID=93172 RepID=UPI000B7EBF9F|nr:hydantoinase B/oxoprolinase family protein [Candidatus Entotheonella palauensis]